MRKPAAPAEDKNSVTFSVDDLDRLDEIRTFIVALTDLLDIDFNVDGAILRGIVVPAESRVEELYERLKARFGAERKELVQ